MNEPKNRQSEPRKAHITSLRWSRPVLVTCSAGASWAGVTACSTVYPHPNPLPEGEGVVDLAVDGLEAPGIDTEEHHQDADAADPEAEDYAGRDQGQAQCGDDGI